MPSLIPGYEYDIFISYRHKDDKYDHWVTDFVSNLRREIEATFRDEVSVYFDSDPADGLLATHEVDESLKTKLRCLIFIPIISHTYCDPASFAWANEFKAFVEHASIDKYGLKIKLLNGNYESRVLPVQIHDLAADEKILCEKILGSKLRGIEFIYSERGVNRPLRSTEDNPQNNLSHTIYRNQINKVANAVKEMITAMANITPSSVIVVEDGSAEKMGSMNEKNHRKINWKLLIGVVIGLILIISGFFLIPKILTTEKSVEKSIAVLPFENNSPDEDNEYFCNGMMDGIVTQLFKIRNLKVMAALSEKYSNSNRDVREIGEELNVSMIMTGSVSKVGNDLRISVKLFDAKTGDHRWSEIYGGEYTEDVFGFQDTIAKMVATALNIVITPREKESIEKIPTNNMLAYEFVLKGWDAIKKWTYGNDSIFLILADNLFDQALKLDPEYIDALGGKSTVYREASKLDSALYFSDKIIKIDPNNKSGLHGTGIAYMYMGRTDSALKYLQKAIEVAPNDSWINFALGQTMLSRNDVIKALSYMQKAYDLGGNRFGLGISMVYFNIGEYEKAKKYVKKRLSLTSECSILMAYWYIYYAQGKYDTVFIEVDSTCNINPCQWNCDIMRFYTYTTLKQFEKAEYHYMKAIEDGFKRTEEADIYLACLYDNTGRKEEALSILNKSIKTNESWLSTYSKNESLLSAYKKSLVVKSQLCASYAMLGNKKKVMEYLPALETTEYFNSHINFKAFPGFDNLRMDPEFVNYVKRREEEKLKIRKQLKEMEKRGEINL